MSTFQPPTTDSVPPIYITSDSYAPVPPLAQRLFRHYKARARGQSVLRAVDGTYRTVAFPTQDQIDAADTVYLGGHIYEVDADEAAALTDAGYTVS